MLALAHIQMVHKAIQLHVSEAAGIRHFPQHLRNGPRHQDAHINFLSLRKLGEKGLRCLPQHHALSLIRAGNDILEIHKGQLRQDQIIHFIEGRLIQGQVSPPIQVIQQICHGVSSLHDHSIALIIPTILLFHKSAARKFTVILQALPS